MESFIVRGYRILEGFCCYVCLCLWFFFRWCHNAIYRKISRIVLELQFDQIFIFLSFWVCFFVILFVGWLCLFQDLLIVNLILCVKPNYYVVHSLYVYIVFLCLKFPLCDPFVPALLILSVHLTCRFYTMIIRYFTQSLC